MNKIKPYGGEEGKKNQVAKMFDNIASKYDLINIFLSFGIDRRWRKKAIRQLRKSHPAEVLDVATGTASVAIEIVKQLPDAKVIGVDISRNMLEEGRKKLQRKNLDDRITLVYGDSEALEAEDNTYDAATVAFGVRNFENMEKGLEEIYRVLKPGGKVVILEFSRPRMFPFRQVFNLYFRHILPYIGSTNSKDPKAYKYLYESVQAFPDYDRFEHVLQKTGFKNTNYKSLTAGICCIYEGEK